ncbi:LysR family transcriptional regulator [Ciceribacter sp. L1K23]|uniref:LysR family transcriptional regulator n=1 Tax=Ciceribacter sp. L1K23 TaxID=2820276 RepID=UPI001B82C4CB|nr:LysR family transcriptional regulator [Ciceribacter sp. L1K23]MBR0556264.1 LysR family transcriptional regulator [Ciceribacter sp. L1K23]
MERNELNDLLAFATVARECSFTKAAARLGISASALSHAMRNLEQRLDVRLLARTTRSVAPTEAGERLLHSINPALASIEDGLAALSHWRDSVSGTVRITASTYAAQTVLMRKLPRFLLDHPDVKVEVNVEDRLADIVAEGFDAGIRFHMSVDKDMIAIPIGPPLRTIVVGTPGYFERHPPPRTPADLSNHVCVNFRMKSGALMAWDMDEGGREFRVRTTGQFVANDGGLMAAVVRAGAGLGYMMEEEVADDIAAGRLVQVLDAWCLPFPGLHLYHPSRRQSPPALRALIAALRE